MLQDGGRGVPEKGQGGLADGEASIGNAVAKGRSGLAESRIAFQIPVRGGV